MKTAVALRHVAFEDAGAFAPALTQAGYALRYLDVGVDALDALRHTLPDLLLVLGGPIGAYEDTTYPALRDVLALIEHRLHHNRPLMGICLGAQLIARALGARVYPMGHTEIGFGDLTLTPAGQTSCLAPFASQPLTLHWHDDTFDLPAGATHLASTPRCAHQAYAVGANTIGFQFHPEAGGPGFERWLIGHACELARAGLDIPALRATAQAEGPALAAKAADCLQRWLSGLTP